MNCVAFSVLLLLFCGYTVAQLDPDCFIQQYWPDYTNCSRFYECGASFQKELMECPPGEYWDQSRLVCDIESSVPCDYPTTLSSSTTTTTPTTTSTTTTTIPITSTSDPSFVCNQENELYPNPYNCSEFYECIGKIKQKRTCSAHLLWDDNIPGCSSSSSCFELTTTTVIPTNPTTFDPSLECDKELELFPDVYNCSGYYQCLDGIKFHVYCTPPLLFEVTLNGCSKTSSCSQIMSTTSTPVTVPMCMNGSFQGDSLDCKRYYYCNSNLWTGPISCPGTLFWSQSLVACVKEDQSDC